MHEPIYDQYFFVNTILFQERYRVEVHSPSSWISWVLLEQPPVIVSFFFSTPHHKIGLLMASSRKLPVPPTRLLHLIQLLHNSLGSCDKSSPLLTLQLPEDTTICDAVPLAAFLLEYPVAYFPVSPDQTSFLPRILLDVYECIIGDVGLDERRQHTFMKFSCPSGLSSRDLLVELKSLFSKRLEAAGVTGEYQVRKHEEIHDRVAL